MSRLQCVKQIMDEVEKEDVVIASTGYISREVFNYKDRPLNFYMMGSMGNALGIGMGVALKKDTDVYVIQGDGACLMSLGSLATLEELELFNLHHCVLINRCHESTGGQPTSINKFSDPIFYQHTRAFYLEKDDSVPPRIPLRPTEIMLRFRNALKSIDDKIQ